MAPASRREAELQAKVPASLRGVARICIHEDCGSDNIELKYFNNRAKVGYNQPRFICKTCGRKFTLGGKVKGYNKMVWNRKSKSKAKTNTTLTSATARIQAAQMGNPRVQNRLQPVTKSTDNWLRDVVQNPAVLADSDVEEGDDACSQPMISLPEGQVTEDDGLNNNNNSEDLIPVLLIQKDLLKQNAKLHLLNAQVAWHAFHVKKEAMNMALSCATAGGSQRDVAIAGFQSSKRKRKLQDLELPIDRSYLGLIGGLRKFAEEAAGGLQVVSTRKYREMVAREAEMEDLSAVLATMRAKVEAMDVERVPHSVVVAAEGKAKRLRDRVVELASCGEGSKILKSKTTADGRCVSGILQSSRKPKGMVCTT